MSARDRSNSPIPGSHIDENVVNIVIAKKFNLVDEDIQVQMLQVGSLPLKTADPADLLS